MNITITPNTNPIDATVLNPVDKSFGSSGGSGGGPGGGPVNFLLGPVNGKSAYGASVAIPFGGPTTLLSFFMDFKGGKNLLVNIGYRIDAIPPEPPPYSLEGTLVFSVETVILPPISILTDDPSIHYMDRQAYRGPTIAGPGTLVKLIVTSATRLVDTQTSLPDIPQTIMLQDLGMAVFEL